MHGSQSTPPVILAAPHADGARLEPQEYLGSRFNSYRDAVSGAGARYLPAIRANVISIDRLPDLRNALAGRGFELAIDSHLRQSLEASAAEAAARAAEGDTRLAEAEKRLRDGVEPFRYQRDGVRWLAPRRAAILADEMGLGKTVQALIALPSSSNARALVIAPAAVASNWMRETLVWRPDLRPARISSRRQWRWPRAGEVLVATYGMLPAEDQELAVPPGEMVVIADEAHLLKGRAGRKLKDGTFKGGVRRVRRWQIVRDAAHSSNGRVWLLTGTPMLNRPTELWRVIEAAASGLGNRVFGGWGNFNQMLAACQGSGDSPEMALALQKVMLRRDRAAVLPDLPRKRRQVEATSISDGETLAACDELVQALANVGKGPEALLEMGELPQKVRQVVFQLLSRVRAALAAAKTPRALEIAAEYEQQEVPVVVFSSHLAPLQALAARPGWELIVGDVTTEKRAETVRRFQAGELKGVACTYEAGGVGITLTRAHHVLCIDQPWTPALLQQAEDRCCRIGQDADSVHVRILAADHAVDLRVAELLVKKTRLIEATVEAAAVEEVAADEALANQARDLAELAASTSEAADAVRAAQDERDQDRQKVEAGRADRERGVFKVGALAERNNKRGPMDPIEVHAAAALVELAVLDPDRSAKRNGMGFSAFDSDFGHSLANQLIQHGRLSPRQWAAAKRLAKKYRRQVGDPPEASG